MTQEDLLQRIIKSNDELTEMNDRYKAEGDSRASRRQLAAAHRIWQIERDELVQEYRATRFTPPAPAATE